MFTVYKTTFLLDGRYYIGVHKTRNPHDRYLGSGIHLREAMKKYGRNNFKKEILFVFDNSKEAYLKEAELVTPELIKSGKVFNIVAGGSPSPEWLQSRRARRKGKPQPNISASKRKISPMVGKFLISYPSGVLDDPSVILYEEVDDLLLWCELNKISESTVRHLMNTGKTAKQGPLRGVHIKVMKQNAP